MVWVGVVWVGGILSSFLFFFWGLGVFGVSVMSLAWFSAYTVLILGYGYRDQHS